VTSHALNRTEELTYRIADMQHAENISQIQLSLLSLPLSDEGELHNKSVQLALSFEKYIKKLTQQHDYNIENVQILREVAKAEKEYLSCKRTIDESYSEEDCSYNWKEYINCSSRMTTVRTKLQWLASEENLIQDQIAQMIKMPNNSISALDLAMRIYNDSMKSNERLKNELTNKLTPLEKRLRSKTYDKDEAVEKY
jgi:hypothetical protein